MKPHLQCGEQQVSRSNLTKYCACHAGRLAYLVLITYETSFTVRGATGVTIQPHQILRLSRRKTHILSPHHIWSVIYSARSNRCHDPTSPNTAPATQNCIAKFLTKSLKTDETSFPMRGRSENDPTMIRAWKRKPQPASQPRLLFELTTSIFYWNWKIQHFAPNLTFKHSPSAAPATKSNTWTSPSTAPATKSNTWTSPSTAPATKKWQLNFTKYCACHEKWLDCFIVLTYETSFPVRGATGVTIQPRQILRLPRKMKLQDVKENRQKQVKRHFQCGADPTMIRAWKRKPQTASQVRLLFELYHEHFLLKNTTFRAQSYIQTFTKYCACHEKCHLNFTKYCACYEKWHLNFTKYLVLHHE